MNVKANCPLTSAIESDIAHSTFLLILFQNLVPIQVISSFKIFLKTHTTSSNFCQNILKGNTLLQIPSPQNLTFMIFGSFRLGVKQLYFMYFFCIFVFLLLYIVSVRFACTVTLQEANVSI